MIEAPATPDTARSLSRLAALMGAVGRQALHGVGCACCARGPAPIQPAAIELDLLGFLAARYRTDGETRLADLLDRWIALPGRGLIARLGDRSSRDSAPADHSRILLDMLAVLETACADFPAGGRA